MNIPEITFGKCIYDEREGDGVYVKSYGEVTDAEFDSYITAVKNAGYALYESHILHNNTFHTLTKGNDAVYLAYYPGICEMRAISEKDSAYLDFAYGDYTRITTTTITHIDLSDFGLSYVIRLVDGKFIIFDGGFEYETDADKLMDVLQEQCVTEKPVIAGWIMTHPHIDHYRCFIPFMTKYRDDVTVERMLFNFPSTDEETQEKVKEFRGYSDECKNVDRFLKLVTEFEIPVIRPHTGQIYDFANAHFEILSSLDDTFFIPAQELNPLSLMMQMTADGQTVLWTGDGYFDWSKMAERWGKYLKSDILQLPHHGFCGGREEEYDLIDAKVCLAPVYAVDAFEKIDIYFPFNRHLLFNTDLQEFISGNMGTTTLELPYAYDPDGRAKLLKRIDEHQHKMGEISWHFENVVLGKADIEMRNGTIFDANTSITVTYADGTEVSRDVVAVNRTTVAADLKEMAHTPDEAVVIDIKSDLPIKVDIK